MIKAFCRNLPVVWSRNTLGDLVSLLLTSACSKTHVCCLLVALICNPVLVSRSQWVSETRCHISETSGETVLRSRLLINTSWFEKSPLKQENAYRGNKFSTNIQASNKGKKSTVIQQEKKSVIHVIYIYIYIYTKTNTGLQKTCQVESPNNPLTGNECQCTIK